MEIVQLGGCTVQEKLAIAREHLAARQIARNGLDPAEVQVTDDTFLAMIEGYTREAGVRGLEHQIGKLLRKVATRVDSGQLAAPTTIGAGDGTPSLFFRANLPHRTAPGSGRPCALQ